MPPFCRLLKRSLASIGAALSFLRLPVISEDSSTCTRWSTIKLLSGASCPETLQKTWL